MGELIYNSGVGRLLIRTEKPEVIKEKIGTLDHIIIFLKTSIWIAADSQTRRRD